MKLSLIVPCFNEAENIEAFQDAVISAFQDVAYDYEIIFIDDGSKDDTMKKLRTLFKEQTCPIKVVSFSRNFGKESGIFAGLQQASGEYISIIDADLQQRPEIVKDMVSILDKKPNYDIVAAYQDRRNEGKILTFFKKGFYGLINKLASVNLRADASDFRTFRRCVADSILSLSEYHRFSKGIFAWVGFHTCFIPYEACERAAGQSKWNFCKLFAYALEGIFSFSVKPLKLATLLGTISEAAAFLYLIEEIVRTSVAGISISSSAVIIMLILFLAGLQFFCIGILGEYTGRTLEQSKKRPVFIAREILTYEHIK